MRDQLRKLLVVNTLTRSVDAKMIYEKAQFINVDPKILLNAYHQISDHEVNSLHENGDTRQVKYVGIMPDILGEYFVVRELGVLLREASDVVTLTDEVIGLVQQSWRMNSDQCGLLFRLIIQDFWQEYVSMHGILSEASMISSSKSSDISNISAYLAIGAEAYAVHKDFALGKSCFRNLLNYLREKDMDLSEEDRVTSWRYLTSLLHNFNVHLLEDFNNKSEAYQLYLETAKTIGEKKIPVMVQVFASIILNLSIAYSKDFNSRQTVGDLYNDLSGIASVNDDIVIDEKLSQVITNFSLAYSNDAANYHYVGGCYNHVLEIAQKRDTGAIWKSFGTVSLNLINAARNHPDKLIEAENCLKNLEVIARIKNLPELQLLLVKSMAAMATFYVITERISPSFELFNKLNIMVIEAKDDQYYFQSAIASYNLITYLLKFEFSREIMHMYENLEGVFNICLTDEICPLYFGAANAMIVQYVNDIEPSALFKIMNGMTILARKKNEPKYHLLTAQSASFLVQALDGHSEYYGRAYSLYRYVLELLDKGINVFREYIQMSVKLSITFLNHAEWKSVGESVRAHLQGFFESSKHPEGARILEMIRENNAL